MSSPAIPAFGTSGNQQNITNPPDPNNLMADPRVYLHEESGLPCYRDTDQVEWEWVENLRSWFPVITSQVLSEQQKTYLGGENDSGELNVCSNPDGLQPNGQINLIYPAYALLPL
jgi:hypothetical protein